MGRLSVVALVLLVAALATCVGLATGGRPRGLTLIRLRRPALLLLAAAVQVLGVAVPHETLPRWAVLAGTALLAGAFVLANLTVPGVALIGVGLVLNTLVIGINGAMPVDTDAAEMAGVDWHAVSDPLHVPASGARLAWLGDVVPVLNPLHAEVVSVGDLLVAAGVGLLIVTALRRGGRSARSGAQGEVTAQNRWERSTMRASESTTRGS